MNSNKSIYLTFILQLTLTISICQIPSSPIPVPHKSIKKERKYKVFLNAEKKYGVNNSELNIDILPAIYDKIKIVTSESKIYKSNVSKDNPLFLAKKDEKFGVLDAENNILIPFDYDLISSSYLVKDGLFGVLNTDGDLKIPFQYSNLEFKFVGGKFLTNIIAQKEKYWWIINEDGNKVIKQAFKQIKHIEWSTSKFRASVENDNHFLCEDKKGNFGIIDLETAEEVVGFDYQKIRPIKYKHGFEKNSQPLIIVRNENKEGIIDLNGKMIVPIEYDSISVMSYDKRNITNAKCKKNGKWGLILVDKKNTVLLNFEYDDFYYLQRDRVAIKKGNHYGFSDLSGSILADPIYDYISYFPLIDQTPSYLKLPKQMTISTQVQKDGKQGKINTEGKITSEISNEIDKGYSDINLLYDDFISVLNAQDKDEIKSFSSKVVVKRDFLEFLKNQDFKLAGYPNRFYEDSNHSGPLEDILTEKISDIQNWLKKDGFYNNFKVNEIVNLEEKIHSEEYNIKAILNSYLIIENGDKKRKITLGKFFKVENKWWVILSPKYSKL